ncbi:GNAT family N-acetyltransferase [Anaerocolumna sp. MB42-C2]|uniref:GNAT family N-acetyltransferase n=1 Tax=Anaerocolumna sp. MB42-C2 TaxID=3070997 RepID=UPI0027E0A43C|nr:GNAT family N-acetyltransferase [Anaerocolumna sp. MB42-C2]WMJ87620.1 GNAT family N-acetyltransferase [Anaerocolumna sp. MB42-C2]
MLKAVIFDMDGVLVDSEPQHARAAVLALQSLGYQVTIDYCYGFIGSTTIHMLETMIKDYNISLSSAELYEVYKETLNNLIKTEGYEPIPYTKDLILDLYHNGIKLAIASSSTIKEITAVAEAFGIKEYFTKLISGTTVSHPKPAPDIFLKAAKELGVNPDECIIVEDSYNGVCAANSAGMPVIGFVNEHSGNQDLSSASYLIEGFDEINTKYIKTIYLHTLNLPVTITETNRLIIKELTVDDIPALYQIYQNEEVKKYIPGISDTLEEEIEKHKSYIKSVYHFYGYGLWGIFDKNSGELMGKCGFTNSIINGKEVIEMGYMLDYCKWGCGYATECLHSILRYAYDNLNIKDIISVINTSNNRSIKTAERVGMKLDQIIIKDGEEYAIYTIHTSEESLS